jgi:hypothetical protein
MTQVNENEAYIHFSKKVTKEQLESLLKCFHKDQIHMAYAYDSDPSVDITLVEGRFFYKVTQHRIETTTDFEFDSVTSTDNRLVINFRLNHKARLNQPLKQ